MAESQWIRPDWTDPGLKLDDVNFDGLPVSEVVKTLRQRFTNAFDVIVPGGSQTQQIQPVGGPVELNSILVNLHLKNVNATEVFNAMNLTFEAENTAARWELRMNGSRPLALLRALPLFEQTAPPVPAPEKKRMVYFVGDLVGDGSHGTMNMIQLYETVCNLYNIAFGGEKGVLGELDHRKPMPSETEIRFYQPSQLLIVSATPDRVAFVLETLKALRDRACASVAQSDAAASANK